jgi:hypothetical protein
MSASEPPSDAASSDLQETLRDLSKRLDSLDARATERQGGLERQLSQAMRALELIHDDDPRARVRLRELRASTDYQLAFNEANPLVSIVIPTWNRLDTLLQRAIPSALEQTHRNVEVLVVGDASPREVQESVAALEDTRVAFYNLPIRGPYETDRYRSWLASGTPGYNAGVAKASGRWIAPLGDDDEFAPKHVERLLAEARSRRLEFVYARGRVLLPDGREMLLGEFPPRLTQIGLQSALYHSGLGFMELELGHAIFDKPNDWGLVHRMMRVGVRIGMVDETTVTYRPSLRAQILQAQDEDRPPSDTHNSDDSRHSDGGRVHALERELLEQRERAEELARQLEEAHRSRGWRLTAALRDFRDRARSR